MSVLIFIIILIVLVLVHEAGHFFSAKSFGIRVDEFGFGFPPKLFGLKKGETEYSFNLLPIGGFVKILGENIEENIPQSDYARSLVAKPKYQQAIVMLAGVLANFILAWLLFSISFMSGLPSSVSQAPAGYQTEDEHLVIISTLENSPAQKAGLKSGDKIISIQNEKETLLELNPEKLKAFILSYPETEIKIDYLRGKEEKHTTLMPVLNEQKQASIGISMDQIGTLKLPPALSFWEGAKLTYSLTKNTALGLFMLLKQALIGQGSFAMVTGPVGMVGIVGEAYQFGFIYLLSFMALISINLAIINLIPFPALDGGRLLFLLIEKIKGSPLSPKISNYVNSIGFAILIIFMLLVTYHDIVKLF